MSRAEEQVVELLGALAESDRRWIIERLSPAAKARLAERIASSGEVAQLDSSQLPAEQGTAAAETRELEDCIARIAAADASSMWRVLCDEPDWLIKAVLQLSDWPWRRMFVQSLPTGMRVEAVGVSAGELALLGSARSWLLRELSARLVALSPIESRPDSRFAVLLARATRKRVRQ